MMSPFNIYLISAALFAYLECGEPVSKPDSWFYVHDIRLNMVKMSKGKDRQDGHLASGLLASNDPAHGNNDNPPVVSLTDIQNLLSGMEERIITNLAAQISANHATIAKHDQTIQAIETSVPPCLLLCYDNVILCNSV